MSNSEPGVPDAVGVQRRTAPPLQVLRAAGHRRMPWRNGAGVTLEIATTPGPSESGDFDWRLSVAEVPTGGPFSAFPGIERTIVLIEGEWMTLTVDGERHHLGPLEPFTFDGDRQTECEVPGPCRDLNVMTRRGRVRATVEITRPASFTLPVTGPGVVVVVGLAPGVRLIDDDGVATDLDVLDTVVAKGPATPTITGEGSAAIITLRPEESAEHG